VSTRFCAPITPLTEEARPEFGNTGASLSCRSAGAGDRVCHPAIMRGWRSARDGKAERIGRCRRTGMGGVADRLADSRLCVRLPRFAARLERPASRSAIWATSITCGADSHPEESWFAQRRQPYLDSVRVPITAIRGVGGIAHGRQSGVPAVWVSRRAAGRRTGVRPLHEGILAIRCVLPSGTENRLGFA